MKKKTPSGVHGGKRMQVEFTQGEIVELLVSVMVCLKGTKRWNATQIGDWLGMLIDTIICGGHNLEDKRAQ